MTVWSNLNREVKSASEKNRKIFFSNSLKIAGITKAAVIKENRRE